VAAKIASKWNKPSGVTIIPLEALPAYASQLPIGKVWGIGTSTSIALKKHGIVTAQDFALRDRLWVRAHFPKPIQEIYEELNGSFAQALNTESKREYDSIQRTKTFRPPSNARDFVFSELSRNVEDTCVRLRHHGLFVTRISFFIKSQDFRYYGSEISLPYATNIPQDILDALRRPFGETFSPRGLYRATGVRVSGLTSAHALTAHLFADTSRTEQLGALYSAIDRVARMFGRDDMVFLGSSMKSLQARGKKQGGGSQVRGNIYKKRFTIPFLGQVS
jgi:nucleotidyltransferase/DNA polymerase involved in DNA repair